MKITWTDEKRKAVCDEIEKWMHKHSASEFGEGYMQSDRCQIDVHDLMCTLIDDIIKPDHSHDEWCDEDCER